MDSFDHEQLLRAAEALDAGGVVPYLGPRMLALCPSAPAPATPEALAALITARVSVPFKIRKRLTQAAQFIENFKHRKTVVSLMNAAFEVSAEPSDLHRALAAAPAPLVVDAWYDDCFARALAAERPAPQWGQIQGWSQSEHPGAWCGCYDGAGAPCAAPDDRWQTLLYRPWGGRSPGANYIVSDSDFVEVLTEIDIQTPIPARVQELRRGRSFLFLGCRFDDQLARSYARQIAKRSSARHWAVLPDAPTRMEARFLEEMGITRIAMPLAEAAQLLCARLGYAVGAAAL